MTTTTSSNGTCSAVPNNQPEKATPYSPLSDELLQRELFCETKDGDRLPVRLSLLLQSKIFATMWKDLDISGGEELDEFVFPVRNISTRTFNKLILWLREHAGQPDPIIEDDPVTLQRKSFTFSEWEQEFFKVEHVQLMELLISSHFLDIPSLYYFGCQAMGALLSEKSTEEIREMFGLEDDLSEEDKAELRRKSVWCNY